MTEETKQTGRPLTTAEAEEGRVKTLAEIAAALATGDMDAFIAAQLRIRFFGESYELAVQREADEESARLVAAKNALKPEAEAAARLAAPEVTLAPILDVIERFVPELVDAMAQFPELRAAHQAATEKAMAICPRAGVAFQPVGLGAAEHVMNLLQAHAHRVVQRELKRVNAQPNSVFFPPIYFIRG